jgi:hypothetical protein
MLLGLLVPAVVIIVVVLLGLRSRVEQNGPVPTTEAVTVEYEFAAGGATTWGMTIPPPSDGAAVTLTKVELEGVSGLDVLGIRACDVSITGCSVVNAAGWPLAGVETVPVEGLQLAPSGGGAVYGLLIGIQRQAQATAGSITAIKLDYTINGTAYEVIEPWSVRILAPGSLAVPS